MEGRKITRALTFDERPSHFVDNRFSPLKRSQTFVEAKSTNRPRGLSIGNAATEKKLSISDVIYRRHFGMKSDELKLIPPLNQNGLKLVLDTPLLHQKDITDVRILSNVVQDLNAAEGDAVIIVDTFSTGALLANMLYKMKFKVICVLSGDLKDLLDMVPDGLEYNFVGTFVLDSQKEKDEALQFLMDQINDLTLNVRAVFAGAETGVELADQLSEAMNLRTNGTAHSEERRNKFAMGEAVRNAGLRAVKQLKACVWGEIQEWISDWQPDPFKVIVKPMDSAGSDDVTLCRSIDEVKAAFGNIMGKVNGLGIVNKAVLAQEYLEGQEYVVDMVSRDGVHKVVAIWAYDRRPVNGAGFVCFGQRLLAVDDQEECSALISYQRKVLDALGIKHGPTHGEVKWCKGEPVLVEVGARCHGGDGLWVKVADECFGCNQVASTVYSYLDEDKFNALPHTPTNRLSYGALKWLINYNDGVYEGLDDVSLKKITEMTSYRGHQIFLVPGKHVIKTQNCFSWGGCAILANASSETLESDYSSLEEMEKTVLFRVQPHIAQSPESAMKSSRAIAVVDPFSTGAVLAYEISQRGFKVYAVYSSNLEQLANLQNLVPQGLSLSFEKVIPFDPDIPALAAKLVDESSNVSLVAVLAGTETGVELADQLSEFLGLRSNGTALSEERRNKYAMGEAVRRAGVRAVKQIKSQSFEEVQQWIENDLKATPGDFKVIVKPVESAGSENVALCGSPEEVKVAFDKILGKTNGLGLLNNAVLAQEYLEGQEYVVDMVSRDGVHKVVAIWAYDRRPVNGAGFVCFGQRLLTVDDQEECSALISYQRKVLDALGIKHGPTHGEVKWCKGEPVLVEVGARCHGSEGAWQAIAQAVYGYEQVNCTMSSYLSQEEFDLIPDVPITRRSYGRLLFLIVQSEGFLRAIDEAAVNEIEDMKSFVDMELFVKLGGPVKKTIDCFTFGGFIKLVNDNLSQLVEDYNRIRAMEISSLFIME